MRKIPALVAAAALAVSVAVSAPVAHAATPASQPTIVDAKMSDYSKKKRNRFYRVVKSYDPLVALVGKKTVISLGVSTCDYLRSGADLYDLVALLIESDAGVAEDSALAVMAAAPVILCPDQQYKFD